MPPSINRTLGCLIANFRPDGDFRLTAQRVADPHTITTNIVYPINPNTNDLHLVDFDGDGYWVMYKWNGSAWVIVAEIESSSMPNNNINEFYVNEDSNIILSQPNNVSKPFTTLLSAVTSLTTSSIADPSLSTLFSSDYTYQYLPDADTVYIKGDKCFIDDTDVTAIQALNKRFRIVLDSFLHYEPLGEPTTDLSKLSYDMLDITGKGSIYGIQLIAPLFRVENTLKSFKLDLNTIYYISVNIEEPTFNFTDSSTKIDVRLQNLYNTPSSNTIALPGANNKGCNINIDNFIITEATDSLSGITRSAGSLLTINSEDTGSVDNGRKFTNINIGSMSSSLPDMKYSILKQNDYAAKVWDNQTLNVNIDLIEGITCYEESLSLVPYYGRALIEIVQNVDLSGSKLNFNFDTITGDSTLLHVIGNPNFSELNINTNRKFNTSDPTIPVIEFYKADIETPIFIKGRYSNYIRLYYIDDTTNYEITDVHLEGTYTLDDIGAFFRLDNDRADNEFTFILNNCKIIGDTSSSLVALTSGIAPASLTLICTNVSTNMMGLLPGWVNVVGSITQNVNFK